jgi:glycosyltransferase involved in cell wall biosynthesis
MPHARLPEDLAGLPVEWLIVPHAPAQSPVWRMLGIGFAWPFRIQSASFNAACFCSSSVRTLLSRAAVTMTFLPRETAYFSRWRNGNGKAHISYFPGGGKRWLGRDYSTVRLVNPAVAIREWEALAEFPATGVLSSGIPRHWLDIAYNVHPVALTLLFVGRLESNKGVMELLDIFTSLAGECTRVHLRVVGDGPLRKKMTEKARRAGLGARISFAGAVSQETVRFEMRRADLLVFPTHFENFPLTLLEAGAVGLPFVASDIAGIRGMVNDQATLVKQGDTSAWVREIRELMGDPARRSTASASGRCWASAYTWESVIDQMEQYILQALSKSRRNAA